MELTLEQLLQGKQTRIRNKEYFPTAAYVEPFINRLSKYTDDFRIQAVLPSQITYTSEGDINLEDQTFNRVWIQAVLPDDFPIPNHNNVIGMVYGLDVRKPVFKVYKGSLNNACTNLCIFSSEALECQEIAPESAVDFRAVDRILSFTDNTANMIHKLMETKFETEYSYVSEQLGNWIRRCIDETYDVGYGKVKIACSTPVEAYKLLFNKEDSDYYLNENPNMYKVYGAFTQVITDGLKKDIMNQVEKSLLVKSILNV